MRIGRSLSGLMVSVTFSWGVGCGDDDVCEGCGAAGMHRGGTHNAGGATNPGGRVGSGGASAMAGAGATGFLETGGVTGAGGETGAGGVTAVGGSSSDAGARFGGNSGSGGADVGSGGVGSSLAGNSGVCEAGNGGEGGSFWSWDPAACNDFHCGVHGSGVTALNEQHCECKPGFQGNFCEDDIDECAQNPCVGACLNTIGGFACQCPAGRTGTQCELPVFQGIGVWSGDTHSEVVAISRDGRQVLASSDNGSVSHVVLFDVASGALKKVSPEDELGCDAVAVNGDGTVVVGTCLRKAGVSWSRQNYIWRSGAFEYLDGALADANIKAISSDGSVLVGNRLVNGGYFAFRADASGVNDWLATLPASSASVSVSADGNIVAAISATGAAYVWSKESGLRRLVGNFECAPQDSVVVSGDGSTFFGSGTHWMLVDRGWISTGPAFRWRGDSIEPSEVGTFAVSDDGGVLLGSYSVAVSGGASVGTASFIRRADGTDLTPELRQLLPSDWKGMGISAISADGKVVAGTASHESTSEGWVAHLP